MGGDSSPEEVLKLAKFVRQFHKKTAWYSGSSKLYEDAQHCFDYIKLGKYVEALGGLNSPTTNQRFYRIENEMMIDITNKFYKR
jgi:anaerobic ribonucleoside-triphosphate reductase activating protein